MTRTITRNIADQIGEAYERMATEARYRPSAPSDGFGNITMPIDELDLEAEQINYALRWWQEEDDHTFSIGCCNYPTRPATIFAIEAARLMCGGSDSEGPALNLLRMAVADLEARA